jgi:hypothetical protein
MSILPVVQQNLELKIEKHEDVDIIETDDQLEDEPEPIIRVRERKKPIRSEIFDIREQEPEPEYEEVEDYDDEIDEEIEDEPEEPVIIKPKKRGPARNYEVGYTEGVHKVYLDKRGNKRWMSDLVHQKARERMLKFHSEGKTNLKGNNRKLNKQNELKSVQQLEKVNEDMLKKYQEDLVKVVQKASFDAVEAYDVKRKARKAEKKATQNAIKVNDELHNKLSGIQQQRQRPKYGEIGYFNQCWE